MHKNPRMSLGPAQFEKLGAFYLGRPYDLAARQGADVPFLYDSRDLLTHAVCVGMTGSGKTGLCIALLEEAAIDGVPAIIIDPKGDLANLALAFPNLSPGDFQPWIHLEDAERAGQTPEQFAAGQAALWKDGLERWGQDSERIGLYKDRAEVSIYTPGSSAGIPVNVLSSFAAPENREPEALAERAQTATASLLGLLKISADPVQSREGILLNALFSAAWSEGRSLDLEAVIGEIQHPPFAKVGVLDLETFYPAKERFALVMALNNIIASPAFAAWRQGDPLDIARCLYTPEGKPRLAVFSIAHLGDDERMFFVSLLLNEILSWTRSQSGTTSLRAILYMDEIFGYLPPTANPPSKLPMLTMLKQARAFGVGVVLATQNPVDLDYKALSNAGTWFIGRLQTERDKARVLDGLQGASGGGSFDRQKMDALLSGLGKRVFLMNNVNDDVPTPFESRWALSYLCGPLTRDQIKLLQPKLPAALVEQEDPRPVGMQRPALPPAVPQVFLPALGQTADFVYRARLLGIVHLQYKDSRLGFEFEESLSLLAELPTGLAVPDWEAGIPSGLEAEEFLPSPIPGASFEELAASGLQPGNYTKWAKAFRLWAASRKVELFRCAEPKTVSKSGESLADFTVRLGQLQRENRDKHMEGIAKKFGSRRAALEQRIVRADAALQREKDQANNAKFQSVITIGSSILGAFLGRKAISATNVRRVGTASRSVGRAVQQGGDVAAATKNAETLRGELTKLEAEFAGECAALALPGPEIETVELKPMRGGISDLSLSLAWEPV